MFGITVTGHLDSGHYLRGYPGKCSQSHGHRFNYEISFSGDNLDELDMLIDFVRVKDFMKKQVDERYDHKLLNDVPPFDEINPTAETLAYTIFKIIEDGWNKGELPVPADNVRVYESPDCYAEYWE